MNTEIIAYYICAILCFVPALVVHEVSHGFAAYKLGDPTAKRAGRLSLNPLKHIDPFGTVILPLILMIMNWPIFGYAKPVPYNPSYFKDPRKGDFITGIAGPLSNLCMALIAAAIAWALYDMWPILAQSAIGYYFYYMFLPMFCLINLYLMFFNLIPIPPLDGSSIIALFIPVKWLPKWYSIQHYAFPIFMLCVIAMPYLFHFNPFSWYLDVTAGNLANLIFPFRIS
ncbi:MULTISPECIES: site-2 protease family protein [unclassified Adlercreutzia]|uniref:site-2 protease family protein n=1 Tax=unclassified Adlercreutzia TaxID=2636013 RepID=UPI0013EBBDB9|nr:MULTISPECIES: site-2 protease family protein [unclassified Adlercreutzia]